MFGKNVTNVEYSDFYKLFCKGIFRISLIDMLNNIQTLSNHRPEIPLLVKISVFRRNLMLEGLNKTADPEMKRRG